MSEKPTVVHIGKVERKRNPLGVVLCAAFIIVGLLLTIKEGEWPIGILFTLIGLPFLLVKENA